MASPVSEPASKRKHKLTAEELNMLSALVPSIDVHKTKFTDENGFERIGQAGGCSSHTVRRFHNKMHDAESDAAPTRKRKYKLLFDLVPTLGTHPNTNDFQQIASLVKCCSNTVRTFHKRFQAEMTASAASCSLVAAGSSAPARACAGGSGGAAGAAPCGWSAPPAQVIFKISRHTRSPLLAAPLPGGKGDFEKSHRWPGGRLLHTGEFEIIAQCPCARPAARLRLSAHPLAHLCPSARNRLCPSVRPAAPRTLGGVSMVVTPRRACAARPAGPRLRRRCAAPEPGQHRRRRRTTESPSCKPAPMGSVAHPCPSALARSRLQAAPLTLSFSRRPPSPPARLVQVRPSAAAGHAGPPPQRRQGASGLEALLWRRVCLPGFLFGARRHSYHAC